MPRPTTAGRTRGADGGELAAALDHAAELAASREALVLVEGPSDRAAVESLAARRGRDLAAERVAVIDTGGATNIGHFLGRLARLSDRVTLAGLCDEAEVRFIAGGLERAGYGRVLDRDDLGAFGFFVCVADLEDELIRALGVAGVEEVIAGQGELGSLRLFQNQVAQRDRAPEDQLHRFMGTRSMRKIRYAALLAEALDLARMPQPLAALLDRV